MNIPLMKRVDATLGRFLASIIPGPSTPRTQHAPASFLVIRPGGIGDAALLAPALRAIKEAFPQSQLTILAERRNAGVFALIPCVDEVFRYDVPREFLQIFPRRFDVIIDTEQYHRLSAVIARLVRADRRVGFATNERARLFHDQIAYAHDDYEVDSFLHLLAPLTPADAPATAAPFLTVPDAAQRRILALLPAEPGERLVALFPGASIPARHWGVDKFTQVGRELARHGLTPVVVGGKEDAAAGAAIAEATGGVNLAGKTNLAETAAVLARSVLLISGDSGVLHIGVGLGVPTVSLFGPGIAQKWGPRGFQDIVLNKQLFCSPCTRFGTTSPCPRGVRCLREITPQEVVRAALSLVSLP